ncbi:hypothetical protein CHS0354_023902 [Potamilus streckersoni]|uniref:Malate synthase n=1 Tax=Potamilus streckersoni TaxID=2493646 RepID=A0AAE0VL70_9BIVA|nr:hypothetical protein CHS0354_023902 [Potamilus streckersoni]
MENDLEITGKIEKSWEHILTGDALKFIIELHNSFEVNRQFLLKNRMDRQENLDKGVFPHFLESTKDIRESDWTVFPVPIDIQDRRVEITGPVERKMIINALNSGAKVFMADFEDSNSPTWENTVQGQVNLFDAVRKTISYEDPTTKKVYKLNNNTAVLFVRPRGFHLVEKHVKVGNKPVSASLFDFGLYLFHNCKQLLASGTGPYFYLPKIESHLEARLWNDIFLFSQRYLGCNVGTIKATVLIETILASFEMDEILYELKEHSAGLNCGRWDYIFSFIKKFSRHRNFLLPERGEVTMKVPFMKAYSELTIKTCHRRNIHAMGGMAAQIPIKDDPEANRIAMQKVKEDKEREAKAGHDGTWVAHPGLIPIALEAFNAYMPTPNQIHVKREDVMVSEKDLITPSKGKITTSGFRNNIDVSLQYIESWLRGKGCVPIYNLMEDAATAEISRAQLWQWLHWQDIKLEPTNEIITKALFDSFLNDIMKNLKGKLEEKTLNKACEILKEIVLSDTFPDFLTTRAYNEF